MADDNGPEFIAHAVADWCRFNRCESIFIDPGVPGRNAWIETFNGRFRDEFLNGRHFDHSAHDGLTPAECGRAVSQCPRR